MKTCETCKWYDDGHSFLGGVCNFSKTDNRYMQAQDDIQAYDPYLEVAKGFGCNQHEAN